ncbi:MAG: hypothetical protein DMG15_24005 [Acidobacteria bacterium]|nr:MAG: hypothetical protein DMG16_21180 [Acidobacteriota bacterium]PYS09384.1 MAG: hypothetical protein DMG15_24005 [Acidobacteriota bacterium]
MEKMFVYPETVESTGDAMAQENIENPRSRADVLSYRCKLYRTLLDQQTASRLFRLVPVLHQEPAQCAHA